MRGLTEGEINRERRDKERFKITIIQDFDLTKEEKKEEGDKRSREGEGDEGK